MKHGGLLNKAAMNEGLRRPQGPSPLDRAPKPVDMGLPRDAPHRDAPTTGGPLESADSKQEDRPSPAQDPQHQAVRPAGGPPATPRNQNDVAGSHGGLGQGAQAFPTQEQAPDIPLTGLGPNIRAILKRSAPPASAVLFECINRLQALARETQALQHYEESIIASNLAGRLAVKTIELTIGKDVNITATIHNQTNIPKWESLPQGVKDRFLEALHSTPQVATATLLEEEAGDRTENDAD